MLLLQTLSDLGLGSQWLHAGPTDKGSLVNAVLRTPPCYFLFQREIILPAKKRQYFWLKLKRGMHMYSQAAFHSVQASYLLYHGSCPASLD